MLNDDSAMYEYLNPTSVRGLVDDHLEGRENRRLLLWSLLTFEHWCQTFLNGTASVMRVLVTGATGFIGRHLVADLGERHEIVALTRGAPPDDLAGAAEWVQQDLAEALDPSRLPRRVDAVIHLAQSRRYKDFPDGAQDIFAVNVHSTFRAAGVGARGRRAASSCSPRPAGCTRTPPRPVREDDPVRLTNLYFRSKYAAEVLLGAYADLLRPVVLRPFFVYGPGQARHAHPAARRADRERRGDRRRRGPGHPHQPAPRR